MLLYQNNLSMFPSHDQTVEMNISLYGENTLVSEVYKNSYHAQRETYLDCFDTAA
jgi:hypothetical protein